VTQTERRAEGHAGGVYLLVLFAHSWVRWFVIGSGLVVAAFAVRARLAARPWSSKATAFARVWVGATDLQVLLGLVLFFTDGGVAQAARTQVALGMREPSLRFFGYLHPLAMVFAFALTHATWIAVRRVDDAAARYRRLATGSLIVLGAILLAVPWTFLPYGRPLLRAAGSEATPVARAEAP